MTPNRPYEFMVKFTPQREWIENRGILIWLSTFFVEVGAATFLLAAVFADLSSMLIGLILCALPGGGLHLADLGRPSRFWRVLFSSSWKTSWIARGIWFVTLFIGSGAVYVFLAYWSITIPLLLVVAAVFAFCTMIYFGFLLSYVRGLALWNSSFLPVLIPVISIWGALNILMLVSLPTNDLSPAVESLARIFPLFCLFTLSFYLAGVRYHGEGGRISFLEMIRGNLAPVFWIGVIFCGFVFPLGSAFISRFVTNLPMVILVISILFQLGANLSLRYCILKCAMYEPIVPGITVPK